ncbi:hypothetical protein FHR59_002338 [Xanthomonas arboricola]|uniref:multiubiquitin domain-containing protein n=1 Tax=Xanthomonas TaxID=338 RepID=UPI00181EAEA7|nr:MULTISPECIES: multiubiquitin domain-containing protein [Xanthomonas]MBB6338075.1 hypothetical protein [Xanthomonas arboricola]
MNDSLLAKPSLGFAIEVADESLRSQRYSIPDPIVTGVQILHIASKRPAAEHLLFQLLPTGALEEIRLEEMVDLREPGTERFVAFKSDRSFRFLVDDEAKDWGAQFITGHTLKVLAQVEPATHEVLLLSAQGNQQIEDGQLFDLGTPGVERFFTAPLSITVFVNTREAVVHKRALSYWDVVRLEHPGAGPHDTNTTYTVSYAQGPAENAAGNLLEHQTVHIKQEMEFYVVLTDKS